MGGISMLLSILKDQEMAIIRIRKCWAQEDTFGYVTQSPGTDKSKDWSKWPTADWTHLQCKIWSRALDSENQVVAMLSRVATVELWPPLPTLSVKKKNQGQAQLNCTLGVGTMQSFVTERAQWYNILTLSWVAPDFSPGSALCFNWQTVSALTSDLSRCSAQQTPCWLHLAYFG